MKCKIRQTKQNVFFLIIGRLFIYSLLYVSGIAFTIWAFLQNTIY